MDNGDNPDDGVIDEEGTVAGGWWPAEGGSRQPERRASERVAFTVRVQLVPPDGKVRLCETIDLGLGGLFLRTSSDVPEVGQLVEIELATHGVTFDGEVVRHGSDDKLCFAVRFVNLDNKLREALRKLVGAED